MKREIRRTLSTSTLLNSTVFDCEDNEIGKMHEVMLDVFSGNVAYVVLSFGGLLGVGNKLFAFPFEKVIIDEANEKIVIDTNKALLEEAPGFDKDNWPDTTDFDLEEIYHFHGVKPYWEAHS